MTGDTSGFPPNAAAATALGVDDVTGPRAAPVLRNVSLSVPRAGSHVVLGPMHSGKSTLLRLIVGLDRAVSGHVTIDGSTFDAARATEDQLRHVRRRVGVVFDSSALVSRLTLLENVALPLAEQTTVRADQARETATGLLHDVGVAGDLERTPDKLTRLDRRRAALARALVLEPAVLIVDEPGNGRDEDGVGGDLPAGTTPYVEAQAAAETPVAVWPRTPDVVLVVLESFRADLLGARFEGTPITPALDALARRGYSSPAAYSHNGYTVQSRFHLYTGTLAGRPGAPTLIDDFKAHGYQVAYFSGQDESFGGQQYDIGFSRADASADARTDRARRYSTSSTPGSLAVPMAVVEAHVADFVAKASPDRPLFLCVNFHDTHFPYTHDGIETITSSTRLPRELIAPGEKDRLWATYVNTAANVDRAIGQVIERVRAARGREPGVIVISDHGESLFDDGSLGHGFTLNDTQTRVPFVVANLPLVVPEPFMQSELRPALLAAMREADGSRTPHARPRGEAPAFQYLGDLGRPRQLSFLGAQGRFFYDFRSGRAKPPSGDWLQPAQLPKPEQGEFLDLVRFWERIQLARHSAWRRTDGDG